MEGLIVVALLLVAIGSASASEENPACAAVMCAYGYTCKDVNNQAKCIKPDCPTICPLYYEPFCGTDGKTYGNSCMLGVANCENGTNVEKAYDGECVTPPPSSSPVDACSRVRCGYGAQCRIVSGRAQCYCQERCPKIAMPLCATNGQTYINSCFLKLYNCRNKTNFTQAYQGQCRSASSNTSC